MALPDVAKDIADFLAAQDLGLTLGENLFASDEIAGEVAPAVYCRADGGPAPQPYLGTGKSWHQLGASVLVRGDPEGKPEGDALARQVADALHLAAIAGYVSVRCLNALPSYLGLDSHGAPGWVVKLELGYVDGAAVEPITGTTAEDVIARLDAVEAQLVPADADTQGFVSKVAQTFAGLKTFLAGIALTAKLTITGVAEGTDAIEIPEGARIRFGAGSRYIYSNGVHIAFPSSVSIAVPGGIVDGSMTRIFLRINESMSMRSNVPDSADAVSCFTDNLTALTEPGAKIHEFRNATVPKACVHADGTIESLDAAAGLILPSPDGTRYRITVANGGTLTVSPA